MKKLLIFILLCLVTLNFTACSTKQSERGFKVIRIAFWGAPEEVDIIKGLISTWEANNAGIKVKLDHINYSGYSSKILTQIAGGAAADIIATEVDMFVNFVKKGVLEPLDEYIANDPEFNTRDFFPEVIDRFTVDGNLYCMPRDTAPFACVYYNKALFDKMGVEYPNDNWTWSDLLEKAKQLTVQDESGNIKQFGFYTWAWQNFIYSNSGQLVDNVKNPTKCLLDSQESLEALQFYSDLINLHKVMPTPIAMTNLGMGVHAMFGTEKLAMFCSGIWETPILRTKSQDWDIAMFPKSQKGKRAFGTGGSGYSITKTSRNKKEAWQVIKALTGKEGQTTLAKAGLVQPANKKIATTVWLQDASIPKNKAMLNKAVKYVTYNPMHTKWGEIDQLYIRPKLELLFNGKVDAKEAVSLFIDKVNTKLQEE